MGTCGLDHGRSQAWHDGRRVAQHVHACPTRGDPRDRDQDLLPQGTGISDDPRTTGSPPRRKLTRGLREACEHVSRSPHHSSYATASGEVQAGAPSGLGSRFPPDFSLSSMAARAPLASPADGAWASEPAGRAADCAAFASSQLSPAASASRASSSSPSTVSCSFRVWASLCRLSIFSHSICLAVSWAAVTIL